VGVLILATAAALTSCAQRGESELAQASLPVRATRLARAPFQPTLRLLGRVGPAATAEVGAPSEGRLRYAPRFAAGPASGMQVAAGELLAVIESPAPEQRLREAEIAARGAERELARARKGAAEGILARAQLDRAEIDDELARERVKTSAREITVHQVRSPIAGRLVVQSPLPNGSQVAPLARLATVVGAGRLRVEMQVPAGDLPKLAPGMAERFLAPGSGGELGRGALREISPVADAAGTARAQAEVSDDRGLPVPGAGVEVEVELAPRPNALLVAEEALVTTDGGFAVFRLEPRNELLLARMVAVRTGERSGGQVEILEGLAESDRIAVGGVALLYDGALVVEEEEIKPSGEGR
jgi:HlyD family secretion protein